MQNPVTSRGKAPLLNVAAFVFLFLGTHCGVFGQYRPQTIQQIQKLVGEKQSRTAAERKISSQLLQAIREAAGKPMVEGVTLKPAEVGADSTGSVQVDISADITPLLLASIKRAGGKIIYPSARFHTVRAKINLFALKEIASLGEVRFITPAAKAHIAGGADGGGVHTGMLNGLTLKQRAAVVRQQLQKYLTMPGIGSVTSQGDHTMGADSARQAYGYQGQGVRVAVLSDSYNYRGNAPADVATGDLPGPGNPFGDTIPVTVLQENNSTGTDEGRAMLQVVHDLAPKAQLFFATAFLSEASFAENIQTLRKPPYNCDIIIDDVIYYDEPSYQDGIVAQAVNAVTADGALYFSSAGNGGSVLMNYASVWEGDFNDSGSVRFAGDTSKAGTVHNFGPAGAPALGDSIENLSEPFFSAGSTYTLKWADQLGGSANDYDLFVVDGQGNVQLASTNIQDGTQDPYEEIDINKYLNYYQGNQLVVFKSSNAKPRAFVINANMDGQGMGFKYTTQGLTYGHSAAAAAFSVAATPAPAAYPGIFTASDQVEYFSSDGPRHIFFNADSTPVTPGNFLIGTGGGTVRKKPDITAADGVSTTFLINYGLNPFYGTSAAAPHAAAVAALLKSASPAISPQQIRNLLTGTALDIEAPGYDINSGYGIVRAFNAMNALNPKPLPSLTPGTITVKEGAFSNHNGVVDPGETATMTVQLFNKSLANATNVRVFLSSTTTGVTVTQNAAYYGAIAKGQGTTNTNSPFLFTVDPSVVCGTKMVFVILASCDSAGANTWAFTDTLVAGAGVSYTITSSLGKTPPAGTGYTAFSGQQKGMVYQYPYPSICGYPTSSPALADTGGLRQFDAYTFANTKNAPECITVSLNSNSTYGANIFSTTYDSAGIVPDSPSVNFKAYAGQANVQMQYAFNVQPGEQFTVVVNDIYPGAASGTNYSLTVSYTYCAATPPCAQVAINQKLAVGATGKAYRQILNASGGSGAYKFSVVGVLPPGMFFNGDSLYGKPSQAGSFPLAASVNDPLSCNVNATINDTLVITGVLPDSIVVFSGNQQQVTVLQAYPDVLQARVFGKGQPLPGVRVIFALPGTGANGDPAGIFAGGVDTVDVVTDSLGFASSPAITADSLAGTFNIFASVGQSINPAIFTLTNTCLGTEVTTSADDGPGSLRYVVQNGCPGAAITFAPGIKNINLTSGRIHIFKSLSITGPGADELTVSGTHTDNIFEIRPPGASDSVNISGITMADGGSQQYTSYSNFGGGALFITQGQVSLSGCAIVNNNASFTSSGQGGGIYIDNGSLTINNCTIAGDTAVDGGGGLACADATININNSTIAGNISTGPVYYSFGGGIYLAYGTLNLVNSTVSGNTAGYGGNVFASNSYYYLANISLKNTIVAGGVLQPDGGTGPDLYGTTFSSLDYNYIQDTSSAYSFVGGLTSWDVRGAGNPYLLPLGNYGGHTPTMLPAPNSPVINKGDLLLTAAQLDQRGYTRVAGVRADIGAVEANYAANATAGTPQTAATNKPFAAALQTKVTENGNATGGIAVVYNAPPDSVASAVFNSGQVYDTVFTNAAGVASAAVTANNKTGIYKITGYIGIAFPPANFYLTNTKTLATDIGPITATVVNCTVQISWQALTPATGETFTVEHSVDGVNYTYLYTAPAMGINAASQTFYYTHQTPATGANYYRVKQTSVNGAVSYSHTVMAVNTCSSMPVVAYPNPAQNILTLVLAGTDKQTVNIYNSAGRLVARLPQAFGTLNINVSRWAAGVYAISVAGGGKITCTLSVVKE